MMKTPTKTQLMVKQELLRRDCVQMKTSQDEYLKFQAPGGSYSVGVFWVGRRGELQAGQRLPRSRRLHGLEWDGLKRTAKENYQEEK